MNFIVADWSFSPPLLFWQPEPGQLSSGRLHRAASQTLRVTQKLSSEDYDRAARSKTQRCPFCLHVNLASYRHIFLLVHKDSTKCHQSHIFATGTCLNYVKTVAPVPQNKGQVRVNRLKVLVLAGSCYLYPPPLSLLFSLYFSPPPASRCFQVQLEITTLSRAHMNMFLVGKGVAKVCSSENVSK